MTWISVKDRLPEPGMSDGAYLSEKVLYICGGKVVAGFYCAATGFYGCEFNGIHESEEPHAITHWQPLPDAPSAGQYQSLEIHEIMAALASKPTVQVAIDCERKHQYAEC